MAIALNDLRKINDNFIKKSDNNYKYLLIDKLLKNDDVFFNINMDTALNILKDLGFNNKESISIYADLISQKNFNG